MAGKIQAVFTGEGYLDDPDGDSETGDKVAAGVPFATTAKRLKELQDQGLPVFEISGTPDADVPDPPSAPDKPAASGKEAKS